MYYGTKDGTQYGGYLETSGLQTYVEISDGEWFSIVEEANRSNKIIVPDSDGKPSLTNPPEPSEEEKIKMRISELERYLQDTDWYAIRYADTGEAIPEEVKKKRQEARDEISSLRN